MSLIRARLYQRKKIPQTDADNWPMTGHAVESSFDLLPTSMKNFDLIAQALAPDTPTSLKPRLRAALTTYLDSYHLPRRHDDVEDFYSALTAKALEQSHQCQPANPLEGWLMLMAHNLVREAKRRAKKMAETPVSQLTRAADGENEAQSQIEFFEQMRGGATRHCIEKHRQRAELPLPSLQELLPSLSPSAQQLLILSIEEGWEIAQIASHLGKTRGAVDTGLCRARAALHKAYQSWKRELEAFEDSPKSQNLFVTASQPSGQRSGGRFS